jgi:hypothetical protein
VIVVPTTRIEIPPSGEIIDLFGFRNCIALREVACRSECHLKNDKPQMFIIDGRDFLRCTALSGVVFRSNFGIAISLLAPTDLKGSSGRSMVELQEGRDRKEVDRFGDLGER